MGLDMHLAAKLYLGVDRDAEIKEVIKKVNPANLGSFELEFLEFEVGYWRKANQIHEWFVQNVQDGKDDCRNYYVSFRKLRELKDLCEEVLKEQSSAEEKLPPRKGVFFGSFDIDENYFNSLRHTVDILDKIFANPEHEEWSIYYHSSW
jgi:hypothetical protein